MRDEQPEISVLIVEDDMVTQHIIASILKDRAKKVYTASNGAEGLRIFQQQRPALVITDILMPLMNGLEMSEKIKAVDKNTQIIVTTAHSDTDYLIDAISIGINQYVLKPVNKDLLLAAFERCIHTLMLELNYRRQKEFNETVLNSISDPLCIIDVNNHSICGANRVFLEHYSIDLKSAVGKTCYKITHQLDSVCTGPDDLCPLDTLSQTGEHASYKHVHYNKNGDRRNVEVSVSPIRNEHGEITHAVHVARDITERIQLEEQLRHAQKMEAVGQLAGGIAHDFNNILTAIIGYGSLLRINMEADATLNTYVEHILASANKAANLTRSLLAFSRKQIMKPEPLELNDIIKNVEAMLTRLIGEDIEFRSEYSDRVLSIMADPGQLEQVLMNLVTNARDAMPQGGRLAVKTEMLELGEDFFTKYDESNPGQYALISVSDTGTGIDESALEKIFEPFFTTKEVGRGTGLGLAMVYGIIKQHNGYINVQSKLGVGTTFKLYIPLFKAVAETQSKESVCDILGGKETILIAEDNEEVRNITRSLLEEFGYTVIEALDGEDAVNKFNNYAQNIDLLLFDVVMPKRNGMEAYVEIREKNPSVKVLFTSGYTGEVIANKGLAEEGINFISKPANPDKLLLKIREILDK